MGSIVAERKSVRVLHSEAILAAGAVGILSTLPDCDVRPWDGAAPAAVVCDGALLPTALLQAPRAAVVLLARTPREFEIRQALERGVLAVVASTAGADELRDAVRSALAGRRFLCREAARELANGITGEPLTLRERDVLALLARGSCNKTIATRLDIAMGTVKAHVRAIMAKLEASSRTEAASIAAARGLVRFDLA